MQLLVTRATGKVGVNLIERLLSDPRWRVARVRALCHSRTIAETDRIEVVKGKHRRPRLCRSHNARRDACRTLGGMQGNPETVMDVTVKGLFWLLEAFRQSTTAKQFMLIGGDAAVGHFFYDHQEPITEHTSHRAYPGCYALSKVLEEVMLSQFAIQYGINTCCLRAPWIMEKDDFPYSLSFGDEVFGGPVWNSLVAPEVAKRREQCPRSATPRQSAQAKFCPCRGSRSRHSRRA
jgi:UDP-glucose 4-epimerase